MTQIEMLYLAAKDITVLKYGTNAVLSWDIELWNMLVNCEVEKISALPLEEFNAILDVYRVTPAPQV